MGLPAQPIWPPLIETKRHVGLTALANHRGGPRAPDAVEQVASRARRAEDAGFDVVSYADLVSGDPFPPLVLAAQATDRAALMTRLVGAFGRSPVHLASGAAWVDRVSRGRFILGLGASLRRATRERLGYDFERPVARMRDVITVMRALWGEEAPGAERNADGTIRYHGATLHLERASVDLLPTRRLPIYLAAAGPRMLRLAGALADGVLMELTTPSYVRWAWREIRAGAAEAGRILDRFDVCVQATFLPPPRTTVPVTSTADHIAFFVRHCCDPEFAHTWDYGGLGAAAAAVREAAHAGDLGRAEAIVREAIFPAAAVDCTDPASFWRWIDGHVAAGATLLAVPLELEELTGITPREVKRRIAQPTA
ncbi:MAG: LLM class F420-dependent oxidoreductase [Dehalococcoidia bacterium]|nr:MAG: LLM class F420-dependent oxidoreductase [Dehalococcoidia bacterium]